MTHSSNDPILNLLLYTAAKLQEQYSGREEWERFEHLITAAAERIAKHEPPAGDADKQLQAAGAAGEKGEEPSNEPAPEGMAPKTDATA